LDQAPNFANWSTPCQKTNIVVIEYLFAGGSHKTKDTPKILGFSPMIAKECFILNHPMGLIIPLVSNCGYVRL
jgi:hypothetical protein